MGKTHIARQYDAAATIPENDVDDYEVENFQKDCNDQNKNATENFSTVPEHVSVELPLLENVERMLTEMEKFPVK